MNTDKHRWGFLFRPGSFWIGTHRAADGSRWCVNLLPGCTLWFGAPPAPRPAGRELLQLMFTRKHDGAEIEVDCMGCPRCKNYIWAARTEIELPQFCAYCGLRFEGSRKISSGDMQRIQGF